MEEKLSGRSHTLICGDAKDPETFDRLMWGHKADVLFTDAPYNERSSDIGGKGQAQHEDFVEAAGEMTSAEFTRFCRQPSATRPSAVATGQSLSQR